MAKRKVSSRQAPPRSITPPWVWWLLLSVVMLLAIVLRYGLLDVPLERDEGEYAYGGQLLLQGILPYKSLYSMKLPGIYAAYAGILALFGQTHTGVHLGLLVVNIATMIVLFLLGKRLFDPLAGVAAAAVFAVLSVSQSVQGVFANAEHFVILPVVAGLLFLLRGVDDEQLWPIFWGGLLLGIGFVVKQHGVAFVAMGGLYLIIDRLRRRPVNRLHLISGCLVFAAGAVCPYALICLVMVWAGVFDAFWLWTVDYARAYTSQVSISHAWPIFKDKAIPIIASVPLLWVLSLSGLTAFFWDERVRQRWIFVVLFVVFSLAALCPGLYFRPHYFVFVLPVAALLAGVAISGMAHLLSNTHSGIVRHGLPVGLTVICLAVSIYQQRSFLFMMTPLQASRATYGSNPFPESLEVARYIQAHTEEGNRIAIIGSEPQIFFYANRRSASGYIYMYPLMENHEFALRMQKEMIREIESVRPTFLVFFNIYTSWLKRPDSHLLVFEWLQKYQEEFYEPVGLVDIDRDGTSYQWGADLIWPPQSASEIIVFRLKEKRA